jgi:choline dehydrogenase-like flavoprotein
MTPGLSSADTNSPIKVVNFNGVGGSTVMYTAHFPRLHPSDFRVHSLDGVADGWYSARALAFSAPGHGTQAQANRASAIGLEHCCRSPSTPLSSAVKFASDSLLEGDGFEPSVPLTEAKARVAIGSI